MIERREPIGISGSNPPDEEGTFRKFYTYIYSTHTYHEQETHAFAE